MSASLSGSARLPLLRRADPGCGDPLPLLRQGPAREREPGLDRNGIQTALSEAALRHRRTDQATDDAHRSEEAAVSVGEDRRRARAERAAARTTGAARVDGPRVR